MKLLVVSLLAALVALSVSDVSAADVVDNVIVDQDNSEPFFIGSETLSGVSSALSTPAKDNAAISSLLDAALSQKYESATIKAWRRFVSGNATLVASSGPALSGEIKCFVGSDGEVVGLQYGSAVVCQKSSRVVNVKIGTSFISNIKVVLGKNARIAGLQFIITNGVSGTSTVTYCGRKKGLSAHIGRAGKAVGALGGTCLAGGADRRRLFDNNSNAGLNATTFTTIVTQAPQGSNDSPPFGADTTFVIDGKNVYGNITSGRRRRLQGLRGTAD